MADLRQFDLIRREVAAWNQWRLENYAVRPDLHGAHLSGAHLSGANLFRADLSGAILSEAG
jgi:uncharacterized protein YjbI with pentapeptide repeats